MKPQLNVTKIKIKDNLDSILLNEYAKDITKSLIDKTVVEVRKQREKAF